ncbi:MAG: NAD(P)H-dependent oxidoreductase subunit E [Acidobacteria bacterium]|nr:NAD(P)H-dependent oxidoreductase subunit E [Acidobacteriota bacterium]
MSFHPLMVYDSDHFHKSERALLDEGKPFEFTRERRAILDDMLTKYPPDQKRSAVLGALYLVQEQEGHLTASGMRHVAGILDMTAAEVEDVATYYVMFFKERVGKYVLQVCRTLSCALNGAERVTEALSDKLGIKVGETDPSGMFTLLEFECLGACDRAPIVMVNNEHWHEKATAESCSKLVDDIKARGAAAFSGCHLKVER